MIGQMATIALTREAVTRRLVEDLARLLNVDPRQLTHGVRMAELFGNRQFDSLDVVEFHMAFEEAFGFGLDDPALSSCETLAEWVDYICIRLGAR